jgi:hypothetical protein
MLQAQAAMTWTTYGSLSVTLLPLLLVGCSGEDTEDALDVVGTTAQEATAMNALTMNALTMNALTMNGQSAPGSGSDEARKQLVAYKLTGYQLMSSASAAVKSALGSSVPTGAAGSPTRGQLAVDLLKYIYSCAMPAGVSTSISGVAGQPGGTVTLQGQLGLASAWATGPCQDQCRQLVSACVLARVNAFGQPVEISMRAPAYGLVASAAEQATFADNEGAFFGNIFGRGQGSSWTGSWEAYACHPTSTAGSGELVAVTHRACARPGGYCTIDVVGPCSASCSGSEGAYASCSKPGGATAYQPIGVYLKPVDPVCGNDLCEAGEATACPVDCSDTLVLPISSAGFSARVVASVAQPVHRSSSVIIVGIVEATAGLPSALNVGSGVTLLQQSPRDMFIVRYEAQEGANPAAIHVVWAVREPIASEVGPTGPFNLDPKDIKADPDGDVAVAGTGFVALYDKNTGQRLWRTNDPQRTGYDAVWINPVGDVVASGVTPAAPATHVTTRYTVVAGQAFASFGSAAVPGPLRFLHKIDEIQYDFYESLGVSGKLRVRRLSSEGVEQSFFDVSTPGLQQPVPQRIAVDNATGQIIVAGYNAAEGGPGKTPFIAQLSPSGTLTWLNVFRSQLQRDLLIEQLHLHDGRIYIAGKFSGPTDFHGSLAGPAITPAFDIGNDAFVARYDFLTGRAEWARTYGGNGSDSLGSFSVDGTGKLWTFGEFSGSARVDWKQISGSNDGGSDIFLERSYPGHNLALHKPAQQSSTYASQGVVGTADKAVDGDTDGAFSSGSVAATNVEQGAFWQLDLGSIRWVDHVLIYRRMDGNSGDLSGLAVQASGTGNASSDFVTKYVYTPDPQHPVAGKVLRVDDIGNIRYVRIRQDQAKSLGLAEVQVWGH